MLAGAGIGGGVFYILLIITFGFSPKTTDVGYMPEQPIPFSHALHAGEVQIFTRHLLMHASVCEYCASILSLCNMCLPGYLVLPWGGHGRTLE